LKRFLVAANDLLEVIHGGEHPQLTRIKSMTQYQYREASKRRCAIGEREEEDEGKVVV
jgi:hypothetical protein